MNIIGVIFTFLLFAATPVAIFALYHAAPASNEIAVLLVVGYLIYFFGRIVMASNKKRNARYRGKSVKRSY